MRVALYARVSREEQAEGYSLDEQLEAMRQFCADRDWEIMAEYIEPGFTARTDERPAFGQLMAHVQEKTIDIVLTHKLDRAFRSLLDQLQRLAYLTEYDTSYVSVVEQIDYSTPVGKMFMSMLGALNQYYSDNLSEEVQKGKRGRVKAGLSNANIPPHGYERIDGQDTIVKEAAEAIRFLFRQYATGSHTYQSLAELMERHGWAPSKRSPHRRWTPSAVEYMLRNRFYTGQVRYRTGKRDIEWLPGQHEAIIDPDLWQEVERTRQARTYKRPKWKTRAYLLQGLLYCDLCGSKLYISGRSYQTYYWCSAHRRMIDCPSREFMTGDELHRQAEALVARIQPPDDWRDTLTEMINHQHERDTVDRKRIAAERRLQALLEQYEWGHIDRDTYLAKHAQAQADIESAQPPPEPTILEAGEYLDGLAWEILTDEERQEVMRLIFKRMNVRDGRIVKVRPHPEFAPLFTLEGLEVDKHGDIRIDDCPSGSENTTTGPTAA